jgi:hypothetical protein
MIQKNLGQPWIFRRTFRPRHTGKHQSDLLLPTHPHDSDFRSLLLSFFFKIYCMNYAVAVNVVKAQSSCEGHRVVVSTDDHKAIRIAPAIY